jgi:copper chaperone CopZ
MEGVQVNSVDVGSASVMFNPEQVTVEKIAGAVNKIGFAAHTEK